MKNKGFTLIELLAVIVILAIIALIATPVILGIINESRENAKKRSAELVVSTVRTAYATAYMNNNGKEPNLTALATAVGNDLANAESSVADTSAGTLTVTTGDKVVCVFTLGSDNKLKLTNACGDYYDDSTASVEIGTIATQ